MQVARPGSGVANSDGKPGDCADGKRVVSEALGGGAGAGGAAGGGIAGKFVTIVATRAYNPIFSSYGLIANNTITASATVETQ